MEQNQATITHAPPTIRFGPVAREHLAIVLFFSILYFICLAFFFESGQWVLFGLLICGELFRLGQAGALVHTLWPRKASPAVPDTSFTPEVDVFVTVAGEPVEIVRQTVTALQRMNYTNHKIHVLNDGFVARKANWQEIESLCAELKVNCITRKTPGGAKAGNVNNALKCTSAPFIAVFDADHVARPDFLAKTIGYFADKKTGFVQTPQYYINRDQNLITTAAWEQQEFFFGAICAGKNTTNSAFLCGTNMVIRRKTLEEVGGLCETNIAEDFLTSLFIHERGWKSVYLPEVLAVGLAPEDLLSYTNQQFRWARGGLEVVFRYNPFLRPGLTRSQRLEYLSSASHWLSGLVIALSAIFPLLFFFFNLTPVRSSNMMLAAVFLPYMYCIVSLLRNSSTAAYSFRAIAFSYSCFPLQIRAVISVLLGIKAGFMVTSKKRLEGNFVRLAIPHILYLLLTVTGFAWAYHREGMSPAVAANTTWALFNLAMFLPYIWAALPWHASHSTKLEATVTVPDAPQTH